MMDKTIALVLAGGRGSRMGILCHMRPKPVLPFAGCFRVIDFSLSNCVHSGIPHIGVLTDYQRSHMGAYLDRWMLANAGQMSIDILEPQKESYSGTAGAVHQNLEYLRDTDAEDVLILAGDHVYKMDYRKMIKFHRHNRADVTIGVARVPLEEVVRFGTVKLDRDRFVSEFVEKSADTASNLASMGIYVFKKDVLIDMLFRDASNPESKHDFGYSILPDMVKSKWVSAFIFDGYWQDIGTKEAYYRANMELLGTNPLFSLSQWQNVLTEKQELAGVMKPTQGTVVNSLISPGCIINGHVENSVLSPGVVVEEGSSVKDSIIMENAKIKKHSIINRSIIDEEATIVEYCFIGYCPNGSGAPGITLIGQDAEVASHIAIGSDCTIMPQIEKSDFAGNIVPGGFTLFPRSKDKEQRVSTYDF